MKELILIRLTIKVHTNLREKKLKKNHLIVLKKNYNRYVFSQNSGFGVLRLSNKLQKLVYFHFWKNVFYRAGLQTPGINYKIFHWTTTQVRLFFFKRYSCGSSYDLESLPFCLKKNRNTLRIFFLSRRPTSVNIVPARTF